MSKANDIFILLVTNGSNNKIVEDVTDPMTDHEDISDDKEECQENEESDDEFNIDVASIEDKSDNVKYELEECDEESDIVSNYDDNDSLANNGPHMILTSQVISMVRKNFESITRCQVLHAIHAHHLQAVVASPLARDFAFMVYLTMMSFMLKKCLVLSFQG